MSTRPKLTDALEAKILVWIRCGAFPHIAAEAEGVPSEVFEQWLSWGTRKSPRTILRYRTFAQNIRQAAGIARLRAEIALREKDAKTWLLSGPGKESTENPGWSSAAKPQLRSKQVEPDPFTDPHLAALVEALLAALAPFPEAREAAAAAIAAPAG